MRLVGSEFFEGTTMDPKAIVKARSRCRLAEDAFSKLDSCEKYLDFCDFWYQFLINASGIFTVLEQGAKMDQRCFNWYGNKKSERKRDPLLSYFHHARNSDEHGLDFGTEVTPNKFIGGIKAEGASRRFMDEGGNIYEDVGAAFELTNVNPSDIPKFTSLDGKPVSSQFTPAKISLVAVTDRGRVYHPPNEHLGTPMNVTNPVEAAAILLEYLRHLIDEAEGFRRP